MSSIEVPVIAGDGIGPEITAAVLKVVDAAVERNGASLKWLPVSAGLSALDEGSELIPQRTLDEIARCSVALKGPCTTPVGEGFTSINVKLRKTFNLYAAVRPVRSMPGVETRYKGVDLIIIRENTEGLYSGVENEVTPGVVMSMKVASKEACQRIATWAFRFANRRQRKKITVLHKANIMKLTDGLFLKCASDVHANDYPNLAFESTIIDAGCMKLVQDPSQFDVLLLENLYGDVISDLCAGLVGGLGVVPGANIGQDLSIFEAVHGSAPDIAGQNIANPLALLMSSVMMLNFLAETRRAPELRGGAELIRKAYDACLISGEKTRDLGGELGTSEFADAVIARLQSFPL
jgi:isocitrate dehydrogenase (NAD+)